MFAPRYYTDFACTAGKCTHSCCMGWEIDIDGETLAYYQSLPKDIGEKILKTIEISDTGASFRLSPDKRCKNLDSHGLCRIYKVLDHEGLCDICREHPRFYHNTDRAEAGLGAACEAAAALILSSDAYADFLCIDKEDDSIPLAADFNARVEREGLYAMLGDRSRPFSARLATLQARYGTPAALPLDRLEYLDGAHRALFLRAYSTVKITKAPDATLERFLAYLIYRHASPVTSLADFSRAVRLSLALLDLFAALITGAALTPVEAAVTLSEEIEYSEENTALLLASV